MVEDLTFTRLNKQLFKMVKERERRLALKRDLEIREKNLKAERVTKMENER